MLNCTRGKQHSRNHIIIVSLINKTAQAEIFKLHLKIQINILVNIFLCHRKVIRIRNTSIYNYHFICYRISQIHCNSNRIKYIFINIQNGICRTFEY